MTQPVTQDVALISSAAAPPGETDLPDESALLQAAREDPAAFARLYDRHVLGLYKFLLGKTGSVPEAEDLTSQTFLSALERLSGYRDQGNFRAWLFTIAHNKWVDFCRKNRRRIDLLNAPPLAPEPDFLQGLIQNERASELAALVKKLPAPESELLRLRLVSELSFREIAALQGKNEDAVKKAYYRLIERMKKEMEHIDG